MYVPINKQAFMCTLKLETVSNKHTGCLIKVQHMTILLYQTHDYLAKSTTQATFTLTAWY